MSSIRHALIAAFVAASCSATGPTAAPGTIATPTGVPTAAPTELPTATPLPRGLEFRPRMPPLVNGEADPCLPLCRREVTTAGPFEVGVRYQTKYFFGGYMTITPKRAWGGGRSEDGTGALDLFLPGADYGVKFAMDLWPVTDRKRVEGVPNTAAGLVGWLRANPRYSISEVMTTTVGLIPAIAVDVWNSPDAPSQYEDCLGEPCSDMFAMEQVEGYGGMLGDDVNRLYFADLEFNATRHVLVVLIEGHDRKDLDSRIPAAEELLATVGVPAHAAPSP